MFKHVLRWGCCMLLVAGAMVYPSVAETPASGAVAKKPAGSRVDSLIQKGSDALAANDATAARDAFADAVQADPRNARAIHGLAIAYHRLSDITKSLAMMDKAMAIPGAIDHAMALNACILQLQNKTSIRAAKIARDYLTAKPTPLDEPIANVLGYALEHADPSQQKTAFYADTKTFYDRYQHRMEEANPGQLRWGVVWEPADRVKAKRSQNSAIQTKVNALSKALADADAELNASKKKLAELEARQAKMQVDVFTVEAAKENIDQLATRRDEAERAYAEAQEQLTRPDPIPAIAELVAIDATCPPLEKAKLVEVATNTPADQATEPPKEIARPRREPNAPADQPADNGSNNPPPADTQPVDPPALTEPVAPKIVQVTAYATAFPVNKDLVVTAASAVESAKEITVQTRDGSTFRCTVVRSDAKTGLALLRVTGVKLFYFDLGQPQAGPITCAALVEENLFTPAGETVEGTAPAPGAKWAVKLAKHPRLSGAPLFQDGKVVGVAMPLKNSDPAAIPAIGVDAIRSLLGDDAPKIVPAAAADPSMSILQISATSERKQE